MLEDLLVDLIKPTKAISLLSMFLEKIIEDETVCNINKNPYERKLNIMTVVYAINLINNDILKLRKRYDKKMCKIKYKSN